ncbi:hypothetical protein [Castellaniella sp.]|uniref:hypothetical protein n=1 Tax=Castellaniella sp. TaxID=1955812 RepID=UPI003A8F6FA8
MVLGEESGDNNGTLSSRLYRIIKSSFKSSWAISAYEVLFTVVVSNLAIFLAVFIKALTNAEDQSFSFLFENLFQESIKPTEIIVFVLALIAPAMWIMVRNIRLWRHSYLLLLFLAVHIAIIVSTSVIFSLALSSTLHNTNLAFYWAKVCLSISLLVWYFTLVYHKKVIESPASNLATPKPGKESGTDVLNELRAG